jgi:hypothetical protein
MIFTFEAMVDAVLGAGQVEGMAAKTLVACEHPLNLTDTPASARSGEMKAVVGEHGVDPVRDTLDEPAKELRRDPPGRQFV